MLLTSLLLLCGVTAGHVTQKTPEEGVALEAKSSEFDSGSNYYDYDYDYDSGSAHFERFCVVTWPKRRLGVCTTLRRCRRPRSTQQFCYAGSETCCLAEDVLPVDLTPVNRTSSSSERLLSSECGLPAPAPFGPMSRIAGGSPAAAGRWRWIVRLGLRRQQLQRAPLIWHLWDRWDPSKSPGRRQSSGDDVQWFCGGVLITRSLVLTAAHCTKLRPDQQRRLVLRLGDGDGDDLAPLQEVAEIIRHPGYRRFAKHADLAILRLGQPAELSRHVLPVCLPSANESFVGQPAAVAGWGRQGYGGASSEKLLEAELTVDDPADCEAAYRTVSNFEQMFPGGFGDTKLCAAAAGRDACKGDSGGPLVITRPDGARVLAGIVSTGYKCAAEGFSGIYTRVAAYVDWILGHV